jgi:hypothetical protein
MLAANMLHELSFLSTRLCFTGTNVKLNNIFRFPPRFLINLFFGSAEKNAFAG